MGRLTPPAPINDTHQLDAFESGETSLDDWLKRRALKNHRNGASKTFVLNHDDRVIAYYSLAVGSAANNTAPGNIRRNMPNQIPVMLLGRLAVDQHWQGQGLGKGLLKDAVLRTLKVANHAGVKALMVHALSESVKHFYKRHGFIVSASEPMTLMLPIKTNFLSTLPTSRATQQAT